MTAFLPPNLLALFAPRDPIPYLSPLDKPAWLKRPWPYGGIAKYVREFEVRNTLFLILLILQHGEYLNRTTT